MIKQLPSKVKPKRGLTAYNIFFKHTRSRIILGLKTEGTMKETNEAIKAIIANSTVRKPPNSRKYRRTHNMIGFSDLAKVIAEKWKAIDPNRKKLFEHYARLDQERYHHEIMNWNDKKQNESIETKKPLLQNTHSYPLNYSGNTNIECFSDVELKPTSTTIDEMLYQKQMTLTAGQNNTHDFWKSVSNFDSRISSNEDSLSFRQHYISSDISTDDKCMTPCVDKSQVTFDGGEYDEVLAKNRKLEESIQALQQELFAMDPVQSSVIDNDCSVQVQSHQDQKRSRAIDGGSCTEGMQQLYHRKYSINDASLSDLDNIQHLNGLSNDIEKSANNCTLAEQVSDTLMMGEEIISPQTGFVHFNDANGMQSIHSFDGLQNPMTDKSTFMHSINDASNHRVNSAQSIVFEDGSKKQFSEKNIMLPTCVYQNKANNWNLDEDLSKIELNLIDENIDLSHDLNDSFKSLDDFWNNGCINLKSRC